MTIQPPECCGIREFADLAGISRQRLHQLHQRGRGPRRVSLTLPDARGRTRAKRGRPFIPKAEGDLWLLERYGEWKRAA